MAQTNKSNKNKQTKPQQQQHQQSGKKSIQEKSAQLKKKQNSEQKCMSCRCRRWFVGSIFLLVLITATLCYDTEVNGKGVFANSATGKMLKNAGLLPYVEKTWYTTMSASARGYLWVQKNLPPYAKPAIKLAIDLFKLGRNAACNVCSSLCDIVSAKLPVVANFLEQYVPGLPQKIEDFSVTVKTVSVDLFGKTVNFFSTQVLVGRFSPDNLSKALNVTQNAALDCVHSFLKKVDFYAKLK